MLASRKPLVQHDRISSYGAAYCIRRTKIRKPTMFTKIFRREKPRVYLGALVVAPRTDFKRHFELETEDVERGIRQSLTEIFTLPSAQHVKEPSSTDLGLDVIVTKFQLGFCDQVSLGDFWLLLFWRPSVTVSSRLFLLKSERTKATLTVTEKMKWHLYVKHLFAWHGLFPSRAQIYRRNMDILLYQACQKILQKMSKSI